MSDQGGDAPAAAPDAGEWEHGAGAGAPRVGVGNAVASGGGGPEPGQARGRAVASIVTLAVLALCVWSFARQDGGSDAAAVPAVVAEAAWLPDQAVRAPFATDLEYFTLDGPVARKEVLDDPFHGEPPREIQGSRQDAMVGTEIGVLVQAKPTRLAGSFVLGRVAFRPLAWAGVFLLGVALAAPLGNRRWPWAPPVVGGLLVLALEAADPLHVVPARLWLDNGSDVAFAVALDGRPATVSLPACSHVLVAVAPGDHEALAFEPGSGRVARLVRVRLEKGCDNVLNVGRSNSYELRLVRYAGR